MSNTNLYYSLWQKYLPVIRLQMKNAVNGLKEVKMSKTEFEVYSTKKVANYGITLETNNGKITNKVNSSIVGRDLLGALTGNDGCASLLANRHYKFSMGKDFVLKISIEEKAVAPVLEPIAELEQVVESVSVESVSAE